MFFCLCGVRVQKRRREHSEMEYVVKYIATLFSTALKKSYIANRRVGGRARPKSPSVGSYFHDSVKLEVASAIF